MRLNNFDIEEIYKELNLAFVIFKGLIDGEKVNLCEYARQ